MKKLIAFAALLLPVAAIAADPTPKEKDCCCCEKKTAGEKPCCDKMKHDAKHGEKAPADPHAGHDMNDHH